jgi:acylaminoacyl-peptidase
VQITSSVKDNVRDIKRSVSSTIFLGSDSTQSSPAVDVGDVVASASAPSGSVCFPRRAVLRETTDKKRYVELWVGDVLEVSEDVSTTHESFYSDGRVKSAPADTA